VGLSEGHLAVAFSELQSLKEQWGRTEKSDPSSSLKTLDIETWLNTKIVMMESSLQDKMLNQKVKVLLDLESESTELDAGTQIMDEARR